MEIENDLRKKPGSRAKKKKAGGRQKGTPNKVTPVIRARVERILSLSLRSIERDMRKMNLQDKIHIVSALTKFVLPTAVRLEDHSKANFTITWKEEKTYAVDNKTN